MVPQAQVRAALRDTHPQTGVSIEVFYADRTLETFGRGELVGFGGLAGAGPPRMGRLPAHSPLAT
jgi:hypothetical protein